MCVFNISSCFLGGVVFKTALVLLGSSFKRGEWSVSNELKFLVVFGSTGFVNCCSVTIVPNSWYIQDRRNVLWDSLSLLFLQKLSFVDKPELIFPPFLHGHNSLKIKQLSLFGFWVFYCIELDKIYVSLISVQILILISCALCKVVQDPYSNIAYSFE